ncbi:MAG TPA: hypothetical protein VJI75_02455 [Candidatus Nanoarchaeia archaeon]|nr:hypothetical protein [Candidatus Nanoarchaeia archaeon]
MKVKNLLIGFAIAVILPFVVGYGINTFDASPEYQQYCNDSYYPYSIPVKVPGPEYGMNCSFNPALDQDMQNCSMNRGIPRIKYDERGCSLNMTCDMCQKGFDAAQKSHQRIVFVVAGIIGVIAIIIGAMLFSVEAVGAGLMGGGIVSLIYGNIVYWQNLDNLMKFLILLAALVIVIYVGVIINQQRNSVATSKRRSSR